MKQFQEPEICTIPLEDLILQVSPHPSLSPPFFPLGFDLIPNQLRSIGIENEESFPFPTQPPLSSLRRAHTILGYLGALKSQMQTQKKSMTPLESINAILKTGQQKENSVFLTPLGKLIARFPIKFVTP
jgi:HrpA-like RNA helicase